MNFEGLVFKNKSLNEDIQVLEDFIKQCPDGSLISRKNRDGSYSFFQSVKDADGKKKEVYLRKSDIKIAKGLAAKEYAQARLKDVLKEKRIMEGNLSLAQNEKEADRFLRIHPGAATLVLPMLKNKTLFAEQWRNASYVRSTTYPEDLKFSTVIPGLKVRSKAEGDILERMVYYDVPFRYEEELVINGIAYHPDFTCLNTETNQIFYWEHQGRWDDYDYVRRLQNRNLEYQKMGIIPWKNLIITTETEDQPLDILWVDKIIQYYLK